ncbi:MAG TPA: hypothetical protein PLR99_03320 [Polyangiaceae bacterium]|nr:hypothetical protein [Polyangiaceae bacterium]
MTEGPTPRPSPGESPRVRALFGVASFAGPLLVAVFGARTVPDPAFDDGALRVLGLSFTGVFRALDVWVAAPLLALPLGTRALRASLACALVTGAAGLLVYALGAPLLAEPSPRGAARGGGTSRLALAVAALAAITALNTPPWQLEGSAVGGTVTGACLVLLAAWLTLRPRTPPTWKALVAGAALGWEPLVGLMTLGVLLVPLTSRDTRAALRAPTRRELAELGLAFAMGLLPLGLGLVVKAGPERLGTSARLWEHALGEGGVDPRAIPWKLLARDELGWLFVSAAILGAALGLRRRETRLRAAVLLALTAGYPLTYGLGLPHGPVRFAAPLLAAIAATGALASAGLYEFVTRIRAAKVPFAPASAALLVVLEWTLPVRAADDALLRRAALSRHAPYAFATSALGQAPPTSVVLLSDPRVLTRLQAARATGLLRDDLTLFPTFDLKGPLARASVNREPKLAGLYRDLALGTLPEEWSLSSLASDRPLLLSYEPKWKPTLAKHLIPDGLFCRFEPEPQGVSDRRAAMDKSSKRKLFLVTEVTGPGRDARLAQLTAHLLRGRAIAMGATGERDSLSKALDELRPYAPDDEVASKLVRRMVTTKGAFPVDDLVP